MNSIINKFKLLGFIAFYTAFLATLGCGDRTPKGGQEEPASPPVPLAGLFVDKASSATSPDGSSWAQAFPNINAAITAVGTSGKKIYVAAGTYVGDDNKLDLAGKSDIHLIGGYKAGELHEKDRANLKDDEMATLDGEGGNKSLVSIKDEAKNISFDGFIFKGVRDGIAMHIVGKATKLVEDITVTNGKFQNNFNMGTGSNDGYGAGIQIIYAKNIELSLLIFSRNEALKFGAGFFIMSSQAVHLKYLKFENNKAPSGAAVTIFCNDQPREVTLGEGLEFVNNEATDANAGGAIAVGFQGNQLATVQSQGHQIIFTSPITHSGNTAAADTSGNINGSLLRIGFNAPKPPPGEHKFFMDMGNSGIELKESILVHIE